MTKLLRMLGLRFLALIGATLLTACAALPPPKSSVALQVNPETAATLNIYRPNNGSVGAAMDFESYVDGVLVGKLESMSTLSLKVAPGTHDVLVIPRLKVLGTSTSKPYTLAVTLAASGISYVRFNVAIGDIAVYGKAAVASSLPSLTEVTQDDWQAKR